MNIYIGEPKTITVSDMQGPAPDGFHIPLSTEWQAIYDAYTGLGLSGGTNFASYLKMPMAGRRIYSNLSLNYRGLSGSGYYWSSTPYNVNIAYYLYFDTSNVNPQGTSSRSEGCPIRCFKDSPVIPTSSWTVLYQGSGNAGIYHNATEGLISISSDGTTWITIQDKNLGATTVYNYGDTMTEANCGTVYQRGNNYGFSGDENYDVSKISQSSTQVNVTGYGPGNYYESSTWITTNPRQSSANNGNNLRGGVSQGTSTKTVPQEVQNIYIGEYKTRHYDYTFKGKTAAEITSEWTSLIGGVAVNSDGATGIGQDNDLRIGKSIPSLETAKKIIISGTVVANHSTQNAGELSIGMGTGWGTGRAGYQVYGSYFNGLKVIYNDGSSQYSGNRVGDGVSGNTYKPKTTIDLENKIIIGELSGFSNSTLALTDARINHIRQFDKLICYAASTWSTISDVSIDIIY